MRISNSFSINNFTNKNLFLPHKQENKSAINFRGAENPIKIATVGKDSKIAIENITKNFIKLQEFFSELSKKYKSANTIANYKKQYEKFVPIAKFGFAFKLDQWFMTINQLETRDNVIKIYTRKKDGSEPHLFLIEQDGRVYANAPVNNPRGFPYLKKYMTLDEINDSRVSDQLAVADRELLNFLECMIVNQKTKQDDNQKVRTSKKPQKVRAPQKSQKERKLPVNISGINKPAPRRGDLLPEFEGAKRREYPDVLKLSEIDEIFEEITGQTINEVVGDRAKAPIPQPCALKKSVVIRFDGEPIKPFTPPKKKTPPAEPKVQKAEKAQEIVKVPAQKAIERSIWGLTSYVEENNSLNINTVNGSVISVTKAEIEDIEYLSIVKIAPNGKKTYFNIDCDNEKLLKTDLTRKPILKDGDVVPYSETDLKILGLQDDFDITLEEIFNSLEDDGVPTKALEPKIKMIQNANDELAQSNVEVTKSNVVEPEIEDFAEEEISQNVEKIKEKVRSKAKFDAKEIANEYFQTFISEFKSEMATKMEEFEKIKKQFFEKKN